MLTCFILKAPVMWDWSTKVELQVHYWLSHQEILLILMDLLISQQLRILQCLWYFHQESVDPGISQPISLLHPQLLSPYLTQSTISLNPQTNAQTFVIQLTTQKIFHLLTSANAYAKVDTNGQQVVQHAIWLNQALILLTVTKSTMLRDKKIPPLVPAKMATNGHQMINPAIKNKTAHFLFISLPVWAVLVPIFPNTVLLVVIIAVCCYINKKKPTEVSNTKR